MGKVLQLLVVNRLLDPGSEFRLHRHWFVTSAMDELLQTEFAVAEKDRLYRCLDRLLEHKQELFVWLKQKWADLFGADFEVLLYDLTSTYFESDPPFPEEDKRKFGYSRDKRGDCVQVARHDLRTPTRAFPHRSEEYDAVLRTWLVRYAFESVHIRHIAWHSLGLVDEARLLGLPVMFSFHDYYTVCPTVKLLDDKMAYCAGRCTPGAGRCQMELWDTDEYPGLKHKAVHDWRKQFFDALTKCSAFVTTSAAAKANIIDAFPALRDRRFEIIPHGRDFSGFDRWLEGSPLVIVEDGRPLTERMLKSRVGEQDILTAARQSQGLERMNQIKYAVLERSGGISRRGSSVSEKSVSFVR